MKILIDPSLAILAEELPIEDKAELLMCIFEYPNRDCDLGIWRYMKKQIDRDAKKYQEKCERMAANGKNRWNPKSDVIVEERSKENETKYKNNCSSNSVESSNAVGFVENSVDKFFISRDFSFNDICRQKPKFFDYLMTYLPAVVERAERTLAKKRREQWLSIEEISKWIQQESVFYHINHGGGQ